MQQRIASILRARDIVLERSNFRPNSLERSFKDHASHGGFDLATKLQFEALCFKLRLQFLGAVLNLCLGFIIVGIG